MHLHALAQVGGVNSIENFARSWTRAAGFLEVTPRPHSFVLSTDQDTDRENEEAITYGRIDTEYRRLPRTSLLRSHLEGSGPEGAIDDDSLSPPVTNDPSTSNQLSQNGSEGKRLGSEMTGGSLRSNAIFGGGAHLTTPLVGSYGTSYGTINSIWSESSMAHAGHLWRQQQARRTNGETEPIIVKEVEQDGKVVLVVAGQSTLPQTIFNSTNVLIGVGLLSLPMGIKYAGWICGMVFLLLSAVVTAYTAGLLAKCMDVDASLITFADLAFVSYGQKARITTSVLFTLELLAACVALVVLFADTLNLLIPGVGINNWKIICGLLLIPLNFAPLRLLSVTSIVGIFSCFCIVLIIFIDGFIKPDSPGSLREPAQTYLFPENWLTLPISFGLLMSPWGGHAVFPNIYRDMRHPVKYKKAVAVTFTFTYLLDTATAAAGVLMFGDSVTTEITANLLRTPGYPPFLTYLMSIFIGIIPLTKVPLAARPIVSTLETLLLPQSSSPHTVHKIIIRLLVTFTFITIAIVFPYFDSIMAFMGSSLCFTICVILPVLFYLKIFGSEVPRWERVMNYVLVGISTVLAIVGTVWAFLPLEVVSGEG